MIGIRYFNHRKRNVSKISAGGRLSKNNKALSFLRQPTDIKNPDTRSGCFEEVRTGAGDQFVQLTRV